MLPKLRFKTKGSLKILKSKLELDFQITTAKVFNRTDGIKTNFSRSIFIESTKEPCISDFITLLISGSESQQLHHRVLHASPDPPGHLRLSRASNLTRHILGPPSHGGVVGRIDKDDLLGHLSAILIQSPGNSLDSPEPPTPSPNMTIEAGVH